MKHGQHGHAIEVAHLVAGEVISVRVLSARGERRAAVAAASTVLALTALAAVVVACGLRVGGRIVHAPTFVALWIALGVSLAGVAAWRARARARRYLVGVDIDDDAFAPFEQALVGRSRRGYELGLAPGMRGILEGGRAPLDVDALLRGERGAWPRPPGSVPGARAELTMAATTFVVRARSLVELGAPAALPRGFWRPFARRAFVPIQLAAVVVFLRAVPLGTPIGEADMKSAIPPDATPWEVEKLLRQEAQSQARTLHACFDPLPLTCQHPGYVGVGLSLSRQGEIRSSWIARSTYGRDCPVEACMSNVISTWFFEPLPESMRIVLPVQVLRTDKPLPVHAALGPTSQARRRSANAEAGAGAGRPPRPVPERHAQRERRQTSRTKLTRSVLARSRSSRRTTSSRRSTRSP